MATRDTEGRREIEAARQRLSAAKSHASFISKAEDTAKQMLATAKKNLEDIQLQSLSSKKEVKDAQKLLKEAEKRWEVIEIDLDDQEGNTSSTNKKRKLSVVSPQGGDNNNNNNEDISVTVTIPYQQGKKLGLALVDVYTNRERNHEDSTTRIELSSSSAVFKFKDQLLLKKRGRGQDVDELIEWGKKDGNVPAFQTRRSGLLPLSDVNSESMKLALNETINPRDIVEKVCYKTGTFLAGRNKANNVAKIIQDPQNYPLDITLKRLPTSTSNNEAPPPQQFDHAMNYVTTIKKRFAAHPEIYRKFLEILHTYEKEQRGIKEVLDEVSLLFADHADLLKEFTYFLPDQVQAQAKAQLDVAAKKAEERAAAREEAALAASRAITNINEIVVQGAGTPGANGIYKRDIDRRGYPSFVKRGRWQGGNEKFVIFRDNGWWKIGLPSISRNLYAGGYTEIPGKTGWWVKSGEEPAPTLQY